MLLLQTYRIVYTKGLEENILYRELSQKTYIGRTCGSRCSNSSIEYLDRFYT